MLFHAACVPGCQFCTRAYVVDEAGHLGAHGRQARAAGAQPAGQGEHDGDDGARVEETRGEHRAEGVEVGVPMGRDDLLGPHDDACFTDAGWGIDFEAELAVATGDVGIGTAPEAALESVRLLLLANDWSLRQLVPAELAKQFGFLQSKPATAFAPVAVTPDEIGAAWSPDP